MSGQSFLRAILVVALASGAVWGQKAASGKKVASKGSPTATQASQPTTTQASQPTTRKLIEDPLLTPRTLVKGFLLAVSESKAKPERINDAIKCLDLSRLEPGAAKEEGPKLSEQLIEILEEIIHKQKQAPDTIPKRPEGDVVVFGNKPFELTLALQADGHWRLSAETVAAIPSMHQALQKAATTQKAEEASEVPAAFRSPRATMETFLNAVNARDLYTAAQCLDLSELSASTRAEIGQQLALKLKKVIDRIGVVVLPEIPDKATGKPYHWHFSEHGRIFVGRQESREREGEWLFTAGTVKNIDELFKAYEEKPLMEGEEWTPFWESPSLWLRERIPPVLKKRVLLFEHWQWVGVFVIVLAGFVVHRLVTWLLVFVTKRRLLAQHLRLDGELQRSSLRPVGMLAMVMTWWGGMRLLGLEAATLELLLPALKFVVTVIVVWASYRLVDLLTGYVAARAAMTFTRMDDVLVPLLRKTLKIVVVLVGFAYILKALGFEKDMVEKLFTGLGIGGLAVALAAQDSLRNFFGSITVVLDRPFQVGDWVKVGNVEGTVQSVGLRSSRILTFYNSEVYIPNSELINTMVDNMGRRRYRRIRTMISVTYSTTPEQLEAFCEGIRELIRQHPYTRRDYYMVWVNEFAASSIDVLLYCFHQTPDWPTELRERHRLFLDIIRLAKRLGVEFAFPTQTIHLAKEEGEGAKASESGGPQIKGGAGADEALTLGRDEAEKIAKEGLGDSEGRPPPFEFPPVR